MNEKNLHASKFSLMEGVIKEAPRLTSSRDFRLMIELDHYRHWQAGQFVMLRWGRHLIGRPFAILDWTEVAARAGSSTKSVLHLWVRRLGSGTEELQNLPAKSQVFVTAPLGHGFSESDLSDEKQKFLFLSGGVGAASILPLAQLRKKKGFADLWVHGEQNLETLDASLEPDWLFLESKSRSQLATKIKNTETGRLTRIFDADLEDAIQIERYTKIVACGPSGMLEALMKRCAATAKLSQVPLYLGLEEKMACGVGLCFSCSVLTDAGPDRCCLEGPWFLASQISQHFDFRRATQAAKPKLNGVPT